MSNVQEKIQGLAIKFAEDITAIIRSEMIDAVNQALGVARILPMPRPVPSEIVDPRVRVPSKVRVKNSDGKVRLKRRSDTDIARTLAKVVRLLVEQPPPQTGMRAESIKSVLGLDAREMPRILKTGVKNGLLSVEGNTRAAIYKLTTLKQMRAALPGGKLITKKGSR